MVRGESGVAREDAEMPQKMQGRRGTGAAPSERRIAPKSSIVRTKVRWARIGALHPDLARSHFAFDHRESPFAVDSTLAWMLLEHRMTQLRSKLVQIRNGATRRFVSGRWRVRLTSCEEQDNSGRHAPHP